MRSSTLPEYKRRLLRVLVHIQEHLDEPLELETLASLACFSPYHFHRIFRGMIGESLQVHIRRLRLERAAMHLKLGRRPVLRIALEAGYDSHEAFSRAFRGAYGVSPSGFRSLRRDPEIPRSPSGIRYRSNARPSRFRTLHPREDIMEVVIRNLPPRRVAFLRHVGPYDQVGRTWERLMTVLGKEGLLGAGTECVGICHDDPEITPPDKIRYDACVTVDDSFRPEEEIGVQVIPGGEYAVATHRGPYTQLGRAYARLMGQWLPRSGRELRTSPCCETYLNDPESTAPADLLTDIQIPLEPRPAGVGGR